MTLKDTTTDGRKTKELLLGSEARVDGQCDTCDRPIQRIWSNHVRSCQRLQRDLFTGMTNCRSCSNQAHSKRRLGKPTHNAGKKSTIPVEKRSNYKRGWYISSDVYKQILVGPGVYRREHTLVMEKVLGRPIRSSEVIHHINGDKLDNRPENLYVCSDDRVHRSFHKSLETVAMSLVKSGKISFSPEEGYKLVE